MGSTGSVPAEAAAVPGAALALGVRLVRALQHCGDRQSALRTVADVLADGLGSPVVVYRALPDGATFEIVGDRGLTRMQHDRIRCVSAARPMDPARRGLGSVFTDLRAAFGSTELTTMDLGCGIAVIGRRCDDACAAGVEIGAMLKGFSDLLPAVEGRSSPRPTAGERDTIRARLRSLSAREREVLALISEGGSTTEIADHLSISPKTVKTHVQNVLAKLDVRSRLGAAALMHRFAVDDPGLHDLLPSA